nr:hypothetical protein [Pandoravirus aubagnensis]
MAIGTKKKDQKGDRDIRPTREEKKKEKSPAVLARPGEVGQEKEKESKAVSSVFFPFVLQRIGSLLAPVCCFTAICQRPSQIGNTSRPRRPKNLFARVRCWSVPRAFSLFPFCSMPPPYPFFFWLRWVILASTNGVQIAIAPKKWLSRRVNQTKRATTGSCVAVYSFLVSGLRLFLCRLSRRQLALPFFSLSTAGVPILPPRHRHGIVAGHSFEKKIARRQTTKKKKEA